MIDYMRGHACSACGLFSDSPAQAIGPGNEWREDDADNAVDPLARCEAGFRKDELRMWMRGNLTQPMPVESLATKMGMSSRNFARLFREETGMTPAKAVEQMRVEAARAMLESGVESIERVAGAVGFGLPERMRRAFHRSAGHAPRSVRRAARRLAMETDPLRGDPVH